MPESTIACSTAGANPRNRSTWSSVVNPITRSTPARLYQDRSKILTSPADGKCAMYRWRYIWLFSRSVGAASATTWKTRGLTRSVRRLMTPPLPAVSRPSKTMHTLAPVPTTQLCRCTNSTWRRSSSRS